MSKRKEKLTADIICQGRLSSSDEDFEAIKAVLETYQNRNQAVLDGLRMLARVAPKNLPTQETLEPSPSILAQFDILNDRIDAIIQKLDYLQSQGYSTQIINAAMGADSADIDPQLQDEIRAQFLANNA